MDKLSLYKEILHKNMDRSEKNLNTLLSVLLSQKRYLHVLRVLDTSRKIVKILNLSEEIGANIDTAVFFHDFAKGMAQDELKDYAQEYGIDLLEMPSPVYHAIVGAWMAEMFFSERNRQILDAVRFHTTGHPNLGHNDVGMVLFLADYLEPHRNIEGADIIWKCLPSDPLDALYRVVKGKISALLEKDFSIAFDSIAFYNLLHTKKRC